MHFKNRIYPLIFFLFFIGYQGISQPSPAKVYSDSAQPSHQIARYDAYFQKEIDQKKLPGVVTLIYQHGKKIHESALGFKDVSNQSPLQTDNIFFIQSMTKPIITTAFMMLYEEGHFFLNDPISKFLPEFEQMNVILDSKLGSEGGIEPAKSAITIAQILSHTAGFVHGIGGTKLDGEVAKAIYFSSPKTIEERVKMLAKQPLASHPGEQWNYSASPDILARLIELFSGMTAAEFLQTRLFDPLGMKDTGYNLTDTQAQRVAMLHQYNEKSEVTKSPRQAQTSGNTVFGGTHGLFSTASDYSIFAQMLLNNGFWNGKRYLSPKTVAIMSIDQANGLFQDPGKGFGLGFAVVDDLAKTKSLGSEGAYYWSGAYCTYFLIDPKEELVAVFMTQLTPFSTHYENKFRQMLYQAID